ncbi:uncharacterized protein C2orf72-like [Dipodomys merriami]|uniref:uncharacterized protein C2orf72-like n=1 Tax=Dipodomys merriami TaxID=94247 RepID=UPI003850E158
MEPGPGVETARAWRGRQPPRRLVEPWFQGRDRVLLVNEFWKREDGDVAGPNDPERDPDHPGRDPRRDPRRIPSDRRIGSRSSIASGSVGGPRGPKRSAAVLTDSAHSPIVRCRRPAKRMRVTEEPEGTDSEDSEAPWTPPGSPGPAVTAEQPAEAGAQLMLVLCGPAALRAHHSGLRSLLREMRAQTPGPPAALLGILVQPRPGEEAVARRRLEGLLCDVFGPGEVHTAVFGPGRPQGALDVQRASRQVPRTLRMDRQTQTDAAILQGEFYPQQEDEQNQDIPPPRVPSYSRRCGL